MPHLDQTYVLCKEREGGGDFVEGLKQLVQYSTASQKTGTNAFMGYLGGKHLLLIPKESIPCKRKKMPARTKGPPIRDCLGKAWSDPDRQMNDARE